MAIPTRPAAGAAIATAWGTDVHDRVFAPKGCKVAGAASSVGNDQALRVLPLDSATDDPGGWLNSTNDTIVVPTGAEGLYLLTFQVSSINGVTTSRDDVLLYKNGTEIARASTINEAAITVVISGTTVAVLVATDILQLKSRQIGTGLTAHNTTVLSLIAVRIGDDWGA